jgi:galactokinase
MTLENLKQEFTQRFGGNASEVKSFFCPGRVNLIGEHIDYNGGYVFPGALTIGITAIWRKRNDANIRMQSLNASGEILVDTKGKMDYEEKDDWGNYPKGMLQYLKAEGYSISGADILFSSNLPDGAGLSSSAAIEVLTGYMALSVEGKTDIDTIWLAQLAQKVENKYIGVNCGIMDQFAVANGKANHAILLDCQTLDFSLVPFDMKDYSLVIMNTNKRRELADSKYNERRGECDEVLRQLNTKYNFTNLCAATLASIDELITDPVLRQRAIHVVSENLRVLASVEVLKKGQLETFGKLLNASHDSLKNNYEVTGLELDTIVDEARKIEGCLGARMTGAGFGGCAIAIVQTQKIENFKNTVSRNYAAKTDLDATFYTSTIGNGVHEIK